MLRENLREESTQYDLKEMIEIIKMLENKEIPHKLDLGIKLSYEMRCWRTDYVLNCGYVILTKQWLEKLADILKNKKCLEIMSGTGALSYYLRKYFKIDIIPTDNFDLFEKYQIALYQACSNKSFKQWMNIENIDCLKAIMKYGENMDYIIMSYPYKNENAYLSLKIMRDINPNCKMIYIGGLRDSPNADNQFFDNINIVNELTEINQLIPFWEGDDVYIKLIK
jgi:hypothetical protein